MNESHGPEEIIGAGPFQKRIDDVLAEIGALRENLAALKGTPGSEGRRGMIREALYLLEEELAHLDIAAQDAREIAGEIAEHEELLWELRHVPGAEYTEIQQTLEELRKRLREITGEP